MVEDATNDALAASSPPQPILGDTDSAGPSDAHHALAIADSSAAADSPKPKTSKRKRAATSKESPELDTAVGGDELMPLVTPKHRPASRKSKAAAVAQEAEATPAEAVAAAVEAVTSDDGGNSKNKVKRQQVKASEVAVNTEVELLDAPVKGDSSYRFYRLQFGLLITQFDASKTLLHRCHSNFCLGSPLYLQYVSSSIGKDGFFGAGVIAWLIDGNLHLVDYLKGFVHKCPHKHS